MNRGLWENFKQSNMCGIVASKGTEEETEKIFGGIMAENFTNFMKTIKPQMQELKE